MIRTRLAVIAAVPLLLGVTACSGGSSGDDGVASAHTGKSSSPTPSATSTLSPEDSMLKFTQCMRAHGVKVQDPAPGKPLTIRSKAGPGGRSDPMDKAQQACQQYLQQGGQKDPASDPKMLDQMVKFAQCMRAHGVNVPDPKPVGGGGIVMHEPKGSVAKSKAAQAACKSQLPGAGSGLSVGGGGGGKDTGPQLSSGSVGGGQ